MVDLAKWLKLNELTSYIKSEGALFLRLWKHTRNDIDTGTHTNMVGASE